MTPLGVLPNSRLPKKKKRNMTPANNHAHCAGVCPAIRKGAASADEDCPRQHSPYRCRDVVPRDSGTTLPLALCLPVQVCDEPVLFFQNFMKTFFVHSEKIFADNENEYNCRGDLTDVTFIQEPM